MILKAFDNQPLTLSMRFLQVGFMETSSQPTATSGKRNEPEEDVLDILDALVEAQVGTLTLNLKTNEVRIGRGLAKLIGIDAETTKPLEDLRENFLHPDDHQTSAEALSELIENGTPYDLVLRIRHTSGQYKFCSARATVFSDTKGEPEKVISVITDIDELERSRETMSMVERMAKIGSFRHDASTRATQWSDGLYEIYGYEPGSIDVSLDWVRSRYVPDDLPFVQKTVKDAYESGEPFDAQTRILTKTGEIKNVRVLGALELGTDGSAIAHYGTLQDITEEVQRESILRQSQKLEAVGNLAGGIAHDFNNHLAVILGNLEILQDEYQEPEAQPLLDACVQAALSSADLTKNMLSFARRSPLDLKRLDLNRIIRDLGKWARRALPATIDVEVSLQAGLWTTETDEALAQSALLNLILNARDAMPDGGKLTIETCNMRVDDEYIQDRQEDLEPGRYAVLSVSDTGCGISSDDMDTIFDPFFTTKEPGQGTGLGLSMVLGFMKQSKGTLRAYSEPGVGTTFNMFFKAESSDAEAAAYASQNPLRTRPGGTRILVAEDNKEVASVLEMTLSAAGYSVVIAKSGDEAKQFFEQDQDFDLLLTDIVMPGKLQGPMLARELRKIRSELPVVFLSGYANEAKVHGNGLRPEDVRLMKPVRRSDLIVGVERALGPTRRN